MISVYILLEIASNRCDYYLVSGERDYPLYRRRIFQETNVRETRWNATEIAQGKCLERHIHL